MHTQNLDRLLIRISNGDEAAFKSLFDFSYAELLNYAHFLAGSKFAAEEIVSAVFINIWQNRNKLSLVSNIKTYLFVSVKNRSFNYLRDNKLRVVSDKDNDHFHLATTFETPESQYLSEELRKVILDAIEQLPERCRMIFRLVREDGLKYQEAADLLDISVKTVEVQMGRATAKMKSAIEPYLKGSQTSPNLIKIAQLGLAISFLQIF
jgi:RNA polymerase sigma-70 factor (family 1)